jgi:hypothetical protein
MSYLADRYWARLHRGGALTTGARCHDARQRYHDRILLTHSKSKHGVHLAFDSSYICRTQRQLKRQLIMRELTSQALLKQLTPCMTSMENT